MTLLAIFIAHPALALLPAVALGLLAYLSGRRIAWVAAAAWLLYAAYETLMARRILCTGECNIRIDLLLLYPLLLGLTLAAAIAAARRRGR